MERAVILETDATRPRATVCVVGAFPPTAGGQGLVNESFRRMLQEAGASVRVIDLSSRVISGSWRRRVSRLPKVLVGIAKLAALLARNKVGALYLGVAGGYGQLYDLGFASLAAAAGVRLYLHHDSYAYLQKRRRLTATLLRVAGRSATHIALCEDMKRRLTGLYGSALQVVVVSNVTNIDPPTHKPRIRTKLTTIGLLSHLTEAKGVLEFLDVAERVCRARPDMRAVLAGAIDEPSLAAEVAQRLLGLSRVKYVGALYGAAKSRFFADIDAFVFPTRYVNEADPRVVNEALAHGVPVVARGRGCIESLIEGGGGTVIREEADFVIEAERLLLRWHEDPALFASMSSGALANIVYLEAEHGPRLTAIIAGLAALSAPTPGSQPDRHESREGNTPQ